MTSATYVSIIGSANMDITAKSYKPLKPFDSNPGVVTLSPGGVARNIAENLARLGTNVKLFAVFSNDFLGQKLLNDCLDIGIDVSQCKISHERPTPIYTAILDNNGEMHAAIIGDTNIITVDQIKKYYDTINSSKIIVLDTNLNENDIAETLDIFKGKDIYVDAISVTKAARIKNLVGKFHTIKMNRMEASFLADCEITDEDSLKKVSAHFLDLGARRVIISLGPDGICYRTRGDEIRHTPKAITPINSTGAGDSLMAGIIHGTLKNKNAQHIVGLALTMAKMTLMSEAAVSDKIDFTLNTQNFIGV
ncbi:MAG: carbohydrate kinase family protein [Defluviitaleaceae bacterium]|nr:carbohydrate kinase family protein [Defluviitaleaceae bacterium]